MKINIFNYFQKLVILISLFAVSYAQRPSYAGSSAKGRPGLASRFKENSTSSTVSVGNRVGEDATGTTEKLPVDARGDAFLVNRLNQWPRENRPFWLLNADQIEAARNPQGSQGNQNRPQENTRSRQNLAQRSGGQNANFDYYDDYEFQDRNKFRSRLNTINHY